MAKSSTKPSLRRVTGVTVRELALALPGVEESTSYRTPRDEGPRQAHRPAEGGRRKNRRPHANRRPGDASRSRPRGVLRHRPLSPVPYVLVRHAAVTRADLREWSAPHHGREAVLRTQSSPGPTHSSS